MAREHSSSVRESGDEDSAVQLSDCWGLSSPTGKLTGDLETNSFRQTRVPNRAPIGGLSATFSQRDLVSSLEALRLSRVCSHDPKMFFSCVFVNWKGVKTIQETISRVKSRRVLDLPWMQSTWEATVDMRVARAVSIVRALFSDALIFGYKHLTQDLFDVQVVRWMIYDWCGQSTSQLKLHLLWLSGYERGVACPKEGMFDSAGLLLDRRYLLWCKQKLRQRSSARVFGSKCQGPCFSLRQQMSETFLQGTKRAMPSVEDEDLPSKEQEYCEQMSTPKPMSGYWGWFMKAEIERTAMEVFGRDSEVAYKPYCVSQKAGYQAPRKLGGILGKVVRLGWIVPDDVLVNMIERKNVIYEVRATLCDPKPLWDYALQHWPTTRDSPDIERLADCQIYWIREPLKVRTITAGSPTLYGALPPILRHLRERMRGFKCFQLTRQACDWAVIEERLNQLPSFKGTDFESDDYKASTNEMSMDATLTALFASFTGRSYGLAEAALGPQRIHAGYLGLSIVQKVGQLMGSFISFPVLNVVNAAVGRAAYELRTGLRLTLDECPFLVNGDDYLGRSDPAVQYYRRLLLGAVGWTQSPGKSYFLRDLVQINSQTRQVWWFTDHFGLPLLKVSEPIPYVNGGFVHHFRKGTHQMDGPQEDEIGREYRERWDSFERLTGGMCHRAREVTLANLRKIAKNLHVRGRVPFVIEPLNPVYLGGFGLSDKIVSKEAARWGLACRRPPRRALAEVWNREAKDEIEEEPLLIKCRRVPDLSHLDEALLQDLEECAEALTQPTPLCEPGFLDPVVRTVHFAPNTAPSCGESCEQGLESDLRTYWA